MDNACCMTHLKVHTSNTRTPGDKLDQGCATCGPRKSFEWPSQYFLKLSVPSILAEVKDRFDVKTPFFIFFPNFRDHYDFGTKSGKSETDFS